MEFAVFVILAVAGAIAVTIYSKIQSGKNLRARLVSLFGKPPEEKETEFESIKRYANHFPAGDLRVDKITWNDLDMDKVFERINACLSSVGEEYLYNTLHEPKFELESLTERERLINFFDENPKERLAAQFALAKLGKRNYNGLPHLIFGADIKLLPRPWLYKILGALPIVAAFGFVINIAAGFVGIFVSFLINLAVHYRTIRLINIEIPAIGYFTSVMKCCKRLFHIQNMNALPAIAELKTHYALFKKAASKAPAAQSGTAADIAESMWLYFSILFLYDIRHYNNFMKMIINNSKEFHAIYKAIGEIDTALAVLSFRKSISMFSLPQFTAETVLDFEEIFHPLIPEPVTNSLKIKRNCLITGSNASGKSTFIKTLAINGILAQTIFTCTAAQFSTRLSMVVTSMALRDNLQDKESYFIVEIKSLKRILNLTQKYFCVCYVDEILRGTNTIERISASASVLQYLHKHDCLCIAASHDIELTRILANKYENYHFREQVTDNEINFDYKLKQGPSTTRNAIKLLSVMGFDAEIVENAEEMAGDMT